MRLAPPPHLQEPEAVLDGGLAALHPEENGSEDKGTADVGNGPRGNRAPVANDLTPTAHEEQPELAHPAHFGCIPSTSAATIFNMGPRRDFQGPPGLCL